MRLPVAGGKPEYAGTGLCGSDNNVPFAGAEQRCIPLEDVETEAIFVRYPREGKGLAETGHSIDSLARSVRKGRPAVGGDG